MFTEEGIFPIGDGLLDVDAERLKGLLVSHDINDIYEVEQTPFARGKFAAVRRAIHKNTGLHFAAKFLKRRRRAQSSDKEIKHEIAVLMLCEGEDNIVNLNAVHESRSDTALLLELATGGELQTILDNEECLSEAQARHCMREVLKALKFLHDRSIAHLDLKPQNILLAGERIEDGLKLCDFGISRVVCEGINVREMAGTPDYVAPEVLQYEPLSLLTDIWSVGVLAYVLLSGFSPFGGDTKQETFLNISQCALTFPDNLFGGVSQAAIDFIRRALRIKPNDRMNAAGCLEHVWLKDECALDRQIYLQAQHDADFVHDDDDEDDDEDVHVEDGDEEVHEEVPNISQQQKQQHKSTSTASITTATTTAPPNKSTHNGHRAHSSSKIPIATSHCKLCPSTETTTAIHTLPQTLSMSLATTPSPKPTQIVTPTRRASDSDKENTYTATFVKKPAASTATIQIGSNGLEDATVIATLTLFPDAPTTPKVIRKTPAAESSSATSVKALVKKFQLEELEAHSSPNGSNSNIVHASANTQQLQMQQQRKATTGSNSNSSNMRRSISGTCNNSSSSGSCNSGRRASEPVTAVHKKQNTANISSNSISSNSNNSSNNNSNSSGSSTNAAAGSSNCSSSGSSTALLLNGRLPASAHHLHHHHMHHHHHHHHHHVVKNTTAAATNNLSLDQGIIC
ncbi:death-associated protein kinase related [Drosophila grimshawi]|uniref:non-specific serine/threonine protein kinase n=1 Tax=Drosophila grimshawi TaxID=7222 RepID=B4JIX7_DROGR|nr:death-associated protein kinase related [Drosophila grimshawi]XP_032593987.1 death-associated protein kinase related [Drosophila grimshawi]XP_032593988.1 death-associated protein kinase related [Drosophila grimshawi]EDV99541.1 GH12374 [Drosophila grimshawi]